MAAKKAATRLFTGVKKFDPNDGKALGFKPSPRPKKGNDAASAGSAESSANGNKGGGKREG